MDGLTHTKQLLNLECIVYKTNRTESKFKGLGPASWVDLRDGVEAKIKLFQNMVMLHIKLKGMTHAATWKQTISAPGPGVWDKKGHN